LERQPRSKQAAFVDPLWDFTTDLCHQMSYVSSIVTSWSVADLACVIVAAAAAAAAAAASFDPSAGA